MSCKIEVTQKTLEQLFKLQHHKENVTLERLKQLYVAMLTDLKHADDMENYRVRCICDTIAQEGYIIEGCDFYCSEKCLHLVISEEEFLELYSNGHGDSYWTDWY